MSRASGKHGPRAPEAEYGRGDDTGITSTTGNIISSTIVERQEVPVAAPLEEFRGMMAHGVPPADVGHYNREMAEHARHPYKPGAGQLPPGITPVPVWIIEQGGGAQVRRTAAPRHITVPASTAAEPARVCGRNPDRVEIRVLNEDTATDIRIASRPGDLISGPGGVNGGALIPWPLNSYTVLPTQGELYAIGAAGSGTPLLSIIEVSEEAAGR